MQPGSTGQSGADPHAGSAPAVDLRNITKRFGTVTACDGVDLALVRGRIHGILGENGAGKSTLMKMLIGLVLPDEGSILIDGAPQQIHSPLAAASLGIGMVHQHFSLVDALTVWENVALGEAGRLDPAAIRDRIGEIADHYGLAIEPDARVGDLTAGLRQRVEIIKCLRRDPTIVIFDEPTSVLTPEESVQLFASLRQVVADEGRAVVLVSHKLDEVLHATDDISIMRQGKVVDRLMASDADAPTLARGMVGREVSLRSERAALGVLVVDPDGLDDGPADPGDARNPRIMGEPSDAGDVGDPGDQRVVGDPGDQRVVGDPGDPRDVGDPGDQRVVGGPGDPGDPRVVSDLSDAGDSSALNDVRGVSPASADGPAASADVSMELGDVGNDRDLDAGIEGGSAASASAVLTIDGATVRGSGGLRALDNLSLELRAGEIVGVAGVEGNGQRELGDLLSSLVSLDSGTVSIDGRRVPDGRSGAMAKAGIGVIPEDRHDSGIVLDMTLAENLVLVDQSAVSRRGVIDHGALTDMATDLIEQFGIQCSGPDAPMWSLSGGNQQRVVLARELAQHPKVLVAAQPTRGLDVGAIEYMGDRLKAAAADGVAVLLISSELEEILDLSHRVVVMHSGRIVGAMDRADVDLEELGLLMGGVSS